VPRAQPGCAARRGGQPTAQVTALLQPGVQPGQLIVQLVELTWYPEGQEYPQALNEEPATRLQLTMLKQPGVHPGQLMVQDSLDT